MAGIAACNAVYDLDETGLMEDVDVDIDDDTIADVLDNCPTDANTPQADEDGDGLGDHCDNCPLDANTGQNDLDLDAVGDVCDPHPVTHGDCLLLFDSFNDASGFAARWTTVPVATTAVFEPLAGRVRFDVPSTEQVLLLAPELTGRFEVQGIASSELHPGGYVEVVSNGHAANHRYSCGVFGSADTAAPGMVMVAADGASLQFAAYQSVSSLPLNPRISVRLNTHAASGQLQLRCRVDYGIALGVMPLNVSPMPLVTDGHPGFYITDAMGELAAIAVYRFDLVPATCASVVR